MSPDDCVLPVTVFGSGVGGNPPAINGNPSCLTRAFALRHVHTHDVIIDTPVGSAQVLTETGLVALRARLEPVLLAIEAGLVLLRADDRVRLADSRGSGALVRSAACASIARFPRSGRALQP